MEKQWKSTVMGVIYAIIIYTVAPILAAFFDALDTVGDVVSLAGGDAGGGAGAMYWILTIASWAAFVWFFMNLAKFIALQRNNDDAQAVTAIRNAYIIVFVGGILGIIPVIGWILGPICVIIGYIMLLSGFGRLSKSTVLPEGAKAGASSIKTSIILSLIAVIVGIIPVIGWIISPILGLIAVVLLFLGWSKIANNGPRA